VPVIFGWSGGFSHGDDRTQVRAAIQEKLGKYKLPLVVALDFFHPLRPFETTEDVLLGALAYSIPVDLDGGPGGAPTFTRIQDGLLVERGHGGRRARARLQALLPFHLPYGPDGRLLFYGRILANPLLEEPLPLKEFAPMPRLVVSKSKPGHMEYVVHDDKKPADGELLIRWHHVP